METRKINLIHATLVGIGQIMLQDNGWTGLLFIIGMLYNNIAMGILFTVGALVGTLTAHVLKYEAKDIRFGLYGFNGALVGAACVFLFDYHLPVVWIAGIAGAALSSVVMNLFIKNKLIAFTFPFVLIAWIIYYALHYGLGIEFNASPLPTLLDHLEADLAEPFYGYAEINFAGNVISGVLFAIGVFIASPVACFYGIIGSILSALLACSFIHADGNQIVNGLFSFSAVLCAITFSGTRHRDFFYASAAVILAVFIHFEMTSMKLPPFTFPFILASWITVFVKNKIEKTMYGTPRWIRYFN